jgi:hypothetical protein
MYAHKLIELLQQSIKIDDHPESISYRNHAIESIKNSIKFDLGNFSDLPMPRSGQPIEYCRLPYSKTYLETKEDNAYFGFLLIEMKDNSPNDAPATGIFMLPFLKQRLMPWPYFYRLESTGEFGWMYIPGIDKSALSALPEDMQNEAKMPQEVAIILNFLHVLNCGNMDFKNNMPPLALNRKRIKSGKLPLYEFKTLMLKPNKLNPVDNGGSHASPRLHLRRGHIRNFRNGKKTWVRACAVGSKKLGVIHKDYKFIGECNE